MQVDMAFSQTTQFYLTTYYVTVFVTIGMTLMLHTLNHVYVNAWYFKYLPPVVVQC